MDIREEFDNNFDEAMKPVKVPAILLISTSCLAHMHCENCSEKNKGEDVCNDCFVQGVRDMVDSFIKDYKIGKTAKKAARAKARKLP